MKAMLGILPSEGEVHYAGEPVLGSDDLQGKLAFAPQFSISHEHLSVEEAIRYAMDLCVSQRMRSSQNDWKKFSTALA